MVLQELPVQAMDEQKERMKEFKPRRRGGAKEAKTAQRNRDKKSNISNKQSQISINNQNLSRDLCIVYC